MPDELLCVGEILWDALPEGLFLGGAPFNVARHLHALGEDVAFVSRVGDDALGREALRRLRAQGLDPALLQVDDALPTGFVRVALDDETGEPDYEIVEPAAWDAIALTDALQQRAARAEAVVFGSLAQRANRSRQTIRHLCRADALRVFDVNLRPPYVDRSVIEYSLLVADIVKLNEDELRQMQTWFDLPPKAKDGEAALAESFSCEAVCVTWGDNGASLWKEGEYWTHPGYSVEVEDTVGAGDAFLAAFLTGYLGGADGGALLRLANRLGAYVASRSGALPAYSIDAFHTISDLALDDG